MRNTFVELTPVDILGHPFSYWYKSAGTLIKPITAQNVQAIRAEFRSLEQLDPRVEAGRFLCVGVDGEMWTCSQIGDRRQVSGPNADGFCLYVQRDRRFVACFEYLDTPFRLFAGDQWWTSQTDGAVVTWNEQYGEQLVMRLVARRVFYRTYTRKKAEGRTHE